MVKNILLVALVAAITLAAPAIAAPDLTKLMTNMVETRLKALEEKAAEFDQMQKNILELQAQLKITRENLDKVRTEAGLRSQASRFMIVDANASCPQSWTEAGLIGFLINNHNDLLQKDPALPLGARFTGDWMWAHPILCKYKPYVFVDPN